MSDGPGGPEGGGPATVANVESNSPPSGIETITPETTKSPFEISQEATGPDTANNIQNLATTAGIENTFDKLSKDRAIEDKAQTPSEKNTGAADGVVAQIHDRLDANPELNKTLTELQNVNQQLDALRASNNPNDQQELARLEQKKSKLTAQYNKQSEAPVPANKTPDATQTPAPASTPESATTNQKPTTETPTLNEAKETSEAEGPSPEQKPVKEPTPEETAKNEAISYFSNHLDKWQKVLDDPNSESVDADFLVASNKALIKQAQEGKFFDKISVSATFAGEPIEKTISSPYQFFKTEADRVEQKFKEHPEFVDEQERIEGAEARKIADMMEKLKPADGEKGDEKNEDPKSEETKKTEQMKKIDDYLSQMKDINPDFDAETFRKNLTENPDQWKTVDDALNVGDQMKTASKEFALKNPDLFKNSGITPEVFATFTAVGSLRAFSDAIEKAIVERTKNPQTGDEEKNKKDGLLLAFLKAVGLIIASGGASAASTAFKEISKK